MSDTSHNIAFNERARWNAGDAIEWYSRHVGAYWKVARDELEVVGADSEAFTEQERTAYTTWLEALRVTAIHGLTLAGQLQRWDMSEPIASLSPPPAERSPG